MNLAKAIFLFSSLTSDFNSGYGIRLDRTVKLSALPDGGALLTKLREDGLSYLDCIIDPEYCGGLSLKHSSHSKLWSSLLDDNAETGRLTMLGVSASPYTELGGMLNSKTDYGAEIFLDSPIKVNTMFSGTYTMAILKDQIRVYRANCRNPGLECVCGAAIYGDMHMIEQIPLNVAYPVSAIRATKIRFCQATSAHQHGFSWMWAESQDAEFHALIRTSPFQRTTIKYSREITHESSKGNRTVL